MGYGIHGYIEIREENEIEWELYKELETGDIGRGSVAQLIFGYGSSTTDCASLFKDRGLPIDASDEARLDFMDNQVIESRVGKHREVFGHTHASTHELPQFLIDKMGPLQDAAEEFDEARALVWFSR